jgi:hypothetical protein
MLKLQTTEPAPAVVPATHHDAVGDLARALDRETEVIHALRDALIEQRAGVASAEADAVNASVDGIGRILLALDEARLHRAAMLSTIVGDPTLPLDRLESALGASLPPKVAAARLTLRHAAEEVAREVSINRAVLHRAVEAGEAFLQALFSAATDPTPVYAAPERPDDGQPGVILNRRA